MRCRRLLTLPDSSRPLVYFGSYGSTTSSKQVSEYGSACADIRLTSRLLINKSVEYTDDEMIVVAIQNVGEGVFLIEFPSVVDTTCIVRAYNAQLDTNINVEYESLQNIVLPVGTSAVSLYFSIEDNEHKITIDICRQTMFTYNKILHTAKWSEDRQSFADRQEGVASSLTQRLNVIEGELWYNVKEGLPLFNKDITITSMDAWLISTIMKHPDVVNILSFTSSLHEHKYSANVRILSKFGELDLRL